MNPRQFSGDALASEAQRLVLKERRQFCYGPGEARGADVGIAGGNGEGLIFRKGEIVRKVPEADLVNELFQEIDQILEERKHASK